MDTLLFIAIVGIASFIKIYRAATQKEAQTTSAPTDNEQEDIERRIREILGQPSPQTTPAQATTAPKPAKSRVVTPQSGQAKHKSSVTYKATTTNKTDSFKAEQPQQAANTSTTSPSPAKSEIEGIMEDFSLERAVIYSEILEPKFKEY
jgi:hypothetical protein